MAKIRDCTRPTSSKKVVLPGGKAVGPDLLALEVAQAVQACVDRGKFKHPSQRTAAIQTSVLEVFERRSQPPEKRYPEGLVRLCPNCGSGDVEFCGISVRPYCVECNYWGPVNFGTAADAVKDWNAKLGRAR